MIAALYVEKNGVYYGLPDVDPWDEARNALSYTGPHPVVAHPPCGRWSIMGQCRGYEQRHYGHRANKGTWLYVCGLQHLPALRWAIAPRGAVSVRSGGGGGRDQRSKTPPAFRDVLLDMARSASPALHRLDGCT